MQYDISTLRDLFSLCSSGIAAVGDETRQSIILTLMGAPEEGMRVGAITKATNLSRPAVSHHIRVLMDASIVSQTKSGTMNFYYLNPDKVAMTNMLHLCQGILELMSTCEAHNPKKSERGHVT